MGKIPRLSLVIATLISMSGPALEGCAEDAGGPPRPDLVCPGDPSCPDEGEAVLYAGASAVDVTPDIIDYQTVDENGNAMFEPPPLGNDEWFDGNGNGEWDFTFIAGLGNPRPARDVHDPVWARAIVLRWKSTTIAVVSLDLIGYFHGDIEDLRESVADLGIDYVSVSSTHNHEGPDTVGIWGMDEMWPGWRQDTFDGVGAGAEQAIREAHASMVPAELTANQIEADRNPGHGICAVQSDGRDPVIYNPFLTVLRFAELGDGPTIATLVNFTSHPESSSDGHQSLSSDWPSWMRTGIEQGIDRGGTVMDGLGGVAVFVNGPLGSQVGPGDVICEDLDGATIEEHGFPLAECLGWNLAKMSLEAIAEAGPAEAEVPLEVRAEVFELPVENYGYHAMMLGHVFHRYDIHGFDDTRPAGEDNKPWIWTEVSWIRIGGAQMVGVGGEASPELFLGGYDGSYTPACAAETQGTDLDTMCTPDNTNPPDLAMAPAGPYLRDYMIDLGAEYPMLWGVTNDEIGYLIPEFDFVLAHPGAYVTEAPGHHYEETNSVGESAWPTMRGHLEDMLTWRP